MLFTMENRVYISIPLDSLIVSGIISGSIIKITAADGLIILERCKDEVCDCDCICDECRGCPIVGQPQTVFENYLLECLIRVSITSYILSRSVLSSP